MWKNSINVAYYAGCVGNYFYPEIGQDVVKILKQNGVNTFYPTNQCCCGAPAFYSGDITTALEMAKMNIEALEQGNAKYIVTVCPGCAVMLSKEYLNLTKDTQEWNQRARVVSEKVRDFSQLIMEIRPSGKKKLSKKVKVTYHDPCHLRRGLGIYKEPRQLLEREGFELVEMADADTCCGFGGENIINYPELSAAVLKRKLDNIEASGVEIVVTNCLPCVLQIKGGLDKRQSKIKVMHMAELLSIYS